MDGIVFFYFWLVLAKLAIAILIGPPKRDERKICPTSFQVLPPPPKRFPRALHQIDPEDESKDLGNVPADTAGYQPLVPAQELIFVKGLFLCIDSPEYINIQTKRGTS